jgi:hypothetical protein
MLANERCGDTQYTSREETRELSKHSPTRRCERPMILVQLIDEPSIRSRGGTAGPDELEGLRRVKATSRYEITAHNGDGAASTHRTMNEHACIGIRAQSARDVPRRTREVRRKLREGRVVQGNLRRVCGHRRWERYVARHRGQYVSDPQ